MSRIVQSRSKAVHIVVVNEIIEVDTFINTSVCAGLTIDGVVYLEIVLVIVRRVETFVALVVSNAVKHLGICPAVIVTVDYLAHEPEIRTLALAEASDALEEIEINAVSGIKTDTVNAEMLYPVIDGINDMIADADIAQIEFDEVIVTVPAFIPEGITVRTLTAEVEILEPAAVSRALTVFLNVHELRELASDMIEHTVEDYTDAVLMEFIADKAERVVVSESAVDLFIVNSIIAVFNGFEYRPEVYCVNIHFLEVRDPVKDLVKAVYSITEIVILWCSAESQRINVIDYGVIVPIHILNSFL